MRITCISDTHTRQQALILPGGDTLIHAGDIMGSGYSLPELTDFLWWFSSQDYTHKILVAGNHDRIFDIEPELALDALKKFPDITYLQDESCIVDGIKFYGSPWTPAFGSWAFQLYDDLEAEKIYNKVPEDTSVLITHGPAFGRLDEIEPPLMPGASPGHLGCKVLARLIDRIKPELHVCGHIHSGRGVINDQDSGITYINASSLGEDYELAANGFFEIEISNANADS
jgi:Icc-related predicted phosphoesterase